ncbi:hypothetical protein Tco_0071199, partial [Tanacetum coccineum]
MVFERVKMKESHTSLLLNRKMLDKQLYQVNAAVGSLKSRIAQSEEHMVSESVKMKQSHTFLLLDKQMLDKQLYQVNAIVESLKSRIAQSEEQV